MISGEIALDIRFTQGNTRSFRDSYLSKLMPLLEKARENIVRQFIHLYNISKEGATRFNSEKPINVINSSNLFPKKDKDKDKQKEPIDN